MSAGRYAWSLARAAVVGTVAGLTMGVLLFGPVQWLRDNGAPSWVITVVLVFLLLMTYAVRDWRRRRRADKTVV